MRSPILYNTEQIQPKQEVFCGHLCFYVLKQLPLEKHLQVNNLHYFINIKMPVDKFGRRDTVVQYNVSSNVSFTQMDNYFVKRDGSNTAIGSINMTGNTLSNVSNPIDNHDAANKVYVDQRFGGTDKVSRSGDSMQGDLDMGGYRIAGLRVYH